MGFLHIILRGLSIIGEEVAVAKALCSVRPLVVVVTGEPLPMCDGGKCNNPHEKCERPNREPVLGYRLGQPRHEFKGRRRIRQ